VYISVILIMFGTVEYRFETILASVCYTSICHIGYNFRKNMVYTAQSQQQTRVDDIIRGFNKVTLSNGNYY